MDVNAMGLVDGYPHVHSSLYPNGYSPHEYHQLMQQQGDMHMQSSTCVPSLIPPGIDPAQVDMRTFYPYQPNEVKHRKRTTRPQLKVLEAVYVHDTKPNASMRKKLADELGMTPRGVQVWFQNRRAKEKNLARKAENGGDTSKKPMNLTSDKKPSDRPPSPSSSSPTPVSNKPAQSNGSSHDMSVSPGGRASPPPRSPLSSSSPMIIPRISTSDVSDGQRPSGRTLSNPDEPLSSEFLRPIHSMSDIGAHRRASLPMNSLSPSASSPNLSALRAGLSPISQRGLPPGFDPSRRGSVDTNMRRLNTHPYAHLAQHANRLYGGATSPRASQAFAFHSGLGLTAEGPSRLDGIQAGIGGRMGMGIRHGSMPHILQHTRSSPPNDLSRSAQPFFAQPSRPMPSQKSFPDGPRAPGASPRSFSMSSGSTMFTNPFASNNSSPPVPFDAPIPPDRPVSPSTTSPPPISQSFLHSHPSAMYAPMRSVQPPGPGPLPEPSFTFGFPSSSPSLSSASSPSDGSTIIGVSNSGENDDARNADDCDDEGSAVSSNYDPASRFGSFASVGSETSWTTYWSDTGSQGTKQGPEGFDAERRGSFASYCLPELLGGLDVGGNANGTQQAFSDEHPAEHRQHLTATQIVEQRRGSASSHEQLVYATEAHDSYQDKNNVYDIPEEQSGYLGGDQGTYTSQEQGGAYSPPGQDAYSPSSTISAGSQMPVDKSTPPAILPQSSSSELVYALQAPGDSSTSAKSGQFPAPASYPDAAANGSQNQQQFDSYNVYDQQQAHYTFPHDQSHSGYNQGQQSVEYEYSSRNDTLGYPPDSVGMGPLCVPPPMGINGLHDGDYVQQYA